MKIVRNYIHRFRWFISIIVVLILFFGFYRLGREHGAINKSQFIKELAEMCSQKGGFMWIEPGHLNESGIITNCGSFQLQIKGENNCFKVTEGGESL